MSSPTVESTGVMNRRSGGVVVVVGVFAVVVGLRLRHLQSA